VKETEYLSVFHLMSGIVHGAHLQYGLQANTVTRHKDNLDEIVEGLAMSPKEDERKQADELAAKPRHKAVEMPQAEENRNEQNPPTPSARGEVGFKSGGGPGRVPRGKEQAGGTRHGSAVGGCWARGLGGSNVGV
jgi:hypothetical protein